MLLENITCKLIKISQYETIMINILLNDKLSTIAVNGVQSITVHNAHRSVYSAHCTMYIAH